MVDQSFSFFLQIAASCISWWVVCARLLQRTKDLLPLFFARYFRFEQSQLLYSFIFGEVENFDNSLKLSFKVIGMLHIVAASGFNVSLVAKLPRTILQSKIGRFQLGVVMLFTVWAYFFFASGGAAMLRAALMGSLALVARYWLKRQYSPLFGLAWTSLIMWRLDPEVVTGLSFQLSAGATLAILLVYPWIERVLTGELPDSAGILLNSGLDVSQQSLLSTALLSLETDGQHSNQEISQMKKTLQTIRAYLRESWRSTLAVQIVLYPLLAVHFQEINLLGLIANPLLLWITPIITYLGLAWLGLAVGNDLLFQLTNLLDCNLPACFFSRINQIVAFLVELPVLFLINTASWLNRFEWLVRPCNWINWELVFVWWGIMLLLIVFSYFRRSYQLKLSTKPWL